RERQGARHVTVARTVMLAEVQRDRKALRVDPGNLLERRVVDLLGTHRREARGRAAFIADLDVCHRWRASANAPGCDHDLAVGCRATQALELRRHGVE